VKNTFAEWAKLVEPGYITANHAALDWQDAASQLVQGTAANYVMGNFAVAVFKEGGMTNDTLGFMAVPDDQPGRAARRGSADRHDPHSGRCATNVEDAKKAFLAYMATADVQTKMNAAMGQLPINNQSKVADDDPFIKAGFEMLSTTDGRHRAVLRPRRTGRDGQDRHGRLPAVHGQPDQLDNILERLEKARQRIYE
jgi:multiple sugar transport system substrate-binding protein